MCKILYVDPTMLAILSRSSVNFSSRKWQGIRSRVNDTRVNNGSFTTAARLAAVRSDDGSSRPTHRRNTIVCYKRSTIGDLLSFPSFFTMTRTTSESTKSWRSSRASNNNTSPPSSSTMTSPVRPRTASRDYHQHDAVPTPRRRLNSRDIPRTYAGLYGNDDDLLPFELNRHRGTLTAQTLLFLLGAYVTLIALVQVINFLILESIAAAWMWTNIIHLIVTLIYIHWIKGSLYDEQGEMNALTLWEQLEATQDTRSVREALMIVPTVLCYAGCHFSEYHVMFCGVNVVVWLVAILAKLPFMNGVRIFGINRTAGIDDDTNNIDKRQ